MLYFAEISFQEKDFVKSYEFLKNSIQLGLEGQYLENALVFLPRVKILSDIISNPVEYNPQIISGISTEYDEYLPAISPDQDYILFTRRYLKKGIDIITPTFQRNLLLVLLEIIFLMKVFHCHHHLILKIMKEVDQ